MSPLLVRRKFCLKLMIRQKNLFTDLYLLSKKTSNLPYALVQPTTRSTLEDSNKTLNAAIESAKKQPIIRKTTVPGVYVKNQRNKWYRLASPPPIEEQPIDMASSYDVFVKGQKVVGQLQMLELRLKAYEGKVRCLKLSISQECNKRCATELEKKFAEADRFFRIINEYDEKSDEELAAQLQDEVLQTLNCSLSDSSDSDDESDSDDSEREDGEASSEEEVPVILKALPAPVVVPMKVVPPVVSVANEPKPGSSKDAPNKCHKKAYKARSPQREETKGKSDPPSKKKKVEADKVLFQQSVPPKPNGPKVKSTVSDAKRDDKKCGKKDEDRSRSKSSEKSNPSLKQPSMPSSAQLLGPQLIHGNEEMANRILLLEKQNAELFANKEKDRRRKRH